MPISPVVSTLACCLQITVGAQRHAPQDSTKNLNLDQLSLERLSFASAHQSLQLHSQALGLHARYPFLREVLLLSTFDAESLLTSSGLALRL